MKNQTNKIEEKAFTATEVGSMLERIDKSIQLLAESMDTKFNNVDKRFDDVEDELGKVETKIDRLQDDMVEVKYELKRKVSTDEFEKLEKRVTKLERISLSH